MLQALDEVPHFVVRDVDGTVVMYGSIWQRSHLVLVCLGHKIPADERDREGVQTYVRGIRALAADDLACVVTHDAVPGLPSQGVVVADRWGEIVHVAPAAGVRSLPSAEDLAEWVAYIRIQCPECEGEAR